MASPVAHFDDLRSIGPTTTVVCMATAPHNTYLSGLGISRFGRPGLIPEYQALEEEANRSAGGLPSHAERICLMRPSSFVRRGCRAATVCYDSYLRCCLSSSSEDRSLPGSPPDLGRWREVVEVKEQPLTPIEIEDDGQHAFS